MGFLLLLLLYSIHFTYILIPICIYVVIYIQNYEALDDGYDESLSSFIKSKSKDSIIQNIAADALGLNDEDDEDDNEENGNNLDVEDNVSININIDQGEFFSTIIYTTEMVILPFTFFYIIFLVSCLWI